MKEFKLNIVHLRKVVETMNDLPDRIKNREVNLTSNQRPMHGIPNCHAGLISLLDLPELWELYKVGAHNYGVKEYSRNMWADTLAEYLGFGYSYTNMMNYFQDHHKLWGNKESYSMFTGCQAFVDNQHGVLLSENNIIIDHWTAVLGRAEELLLLINE